ncbi:MAG: hypothetical protein DMG21_02390 [Acidobacteria bacterium]|nr:MAG: hypothetical protein DMG21_02390 [Acidobacteriota bacterium]
MSVPRSALKSWRALSADAGRPVFGPAARCAFAWPSRKTRSRRALNTPCESLALSLKMENRWAARRLTSRVQIMGRSEGDLFLSKDLWQVGNSARGLALALALAGMMLAAAPAGARREVVERIVARVNGNIVTQRQYDRELEKLRAELSQKSSGDELEKQVREQSRNLLRDLIDQDLMVQKAKDLDINVDTDVVKRLDEMRKGYGFATQEDLQTEVEKQGLIWEDFADNIKRQLLMREVIGREVGRTVIVSREDARIYFEQHKDQFAHAPGVHLAEILISNEKHPADAEKRANDALAEIKAGDRWEDVVKKYSDDTANPAAGDIGFMEQGTMNPVIAQALANVDAGETTGVIPTKQGYLILKVLEHRTAGPAKFDEVEEQVEETLYDQKMQPALRKYLQQLRKESYIYIASGFIDTGAEPFAGTGSTKAGQ